MNATRGLVLLLLAAMVAGCAANPPRPQATDTAPHDASVYVIRHGWHTGVAVRRADVATGRWPESGHFARAAYIEVGWGDRDFYRAPGFNAWYGVKALFWPTPSVLHVAGLRRSPAHEFGADDMVELSVTRAGLEGLIAYISASFERPGQQAATPLGPGLYGDGAFYASRETFHLFRTCNVWIARALQAAGVPIEPATSIAAASLMAQARRIQGHPNK